MEPIEIDTLKIVETFHHGSPQQKNSLVKLLLLERSVRKVIIFAINFGLDPNDAQSIMHDSIIALMQNVEREQFTTGNWRSYLTQIFKNKSADAFQSKKAHQLLPMQDPNGVISERTPDKTTNLPNDYWLQPFDPAMLEFDRKQAYDLAFDLFDQLDPCKRDACSTICKAYVQHEYSHKELLSHLEEIGLDWDKNNYADPDSPESLQLRHQRLRDRIRECWRRLRAYLNRMPKISNEILEALKQL